VSQNPDPERMSENPAEPFRAVSMSRFATRYNSLFTGALAVQSGPSIDELATIKANAPIVDDYAAIAAKLGLEAWLREAEHHNRSVGPVGPHQMRYPQGGNLHLR